MKNRVLILGLAWAAGTFSVASAKDTSRIAQLQTRQTTLMQACFKNRGALNSPAKMKKSDATMKKISDEMNKLSAEAYKNMNSGTMSKMQDITPEKQKSINQMMDQEFQLLGVDPKTTYK